MDVPGPVICGLFLKGALLRCFCTGCRMNAACLWYKRGLGQNDSGCYRVNLRSKKQHKTDTFFLALNTKMVFLALAVAMDMVCLP